MVSQVLLTFCELSIAARLSVEWGDTGVSLWGCRGVVHVIQLAIVCMEYDRHYLARVDVLPQTRSFVEVGIEDSQKGSPFLLTIRLECCNLNTHELLITEGGMATYGVRTKT